MTSNSDSIAPRLEGSLEPMLLARFISDETQQGLTTPAVVPQHVGFHGFRDSRSVVPQLVGFERKFWLQNIAPASFIGHRKRPITFGGGNYFGKQNKLTILESFTLQSFAVAI